MSLELGGIQNNDRYNFDYKILSDHHHNIVNEFKYQSKISQKQKLYTSWNELKDLGVDFTFISRNFIRVLMMWISWNLRLHEMI